MPAFFAKMTAIIGIIAAILIIFPGPVAEAGFFDRIGDIYNAPDKINEIERQYSEANEALAKQLEQTLQAVEDSEQKQQELVELNKRLIAQNESLQAEIERLQRQKELLKQKAVYTGVIAAVLIAAYIVSVRVWRYMAWRRHQNAGRRGISG
ncbi:hypothetical protein ACFSL6_19775 [Paenibacillus thailandensis]|uniref:Uncharacterized protein n=1 Tax=Paenibacillus thailandensis TaxID=393250 RepID=A0ABW5QUX0_9BACL